MNTAPLPSTTRFPDSANGGLAASRLVSASEANDLQLIRQVAAGEPQAFETLYHRYTPRLRGFLMRRLSQPELVDDILHEVMLVIWQQAGRFQARARLSSWIFGIAQLKVRRAQAQAVRQQSVLLSIPCAESAADDPEGLLLHQEQIRCLALR